MCFSSAIGDCQRFKYEKVNKDRFENSIFLITDFGFEMHI